MRGAELHVASATVKVAGAPLDPVVMNLVEKIEVRSAIGLPDMASVRIADPEGSMLGNPAGNGRPTTMPVALGDPVEISLGDIGALNPSPLFEGEVLALEPEFSTDGAMVCFRAYDKSARLQRGRKSRNFLKVTASDVISTIAGEHALPGEFAATSEVHDFVQQSMESDWDFCRRLAATANMEFGYKAGKGLFLRAPAAAPAVKAELEWGRALYSFRPRMTAVQQPREVEVRNWDPKAKQEIVATATTPATVPAAVKSKRDAISGLGPGRLQIADRVVTSQAEASKLAQSTLDQLASGFFEADGVAEGSPKLAAGDAVELKNVGEFNGGYVLSTVVHAYGHGNYKTRFTIAGRNPRTLTDLVRPKPDRDWATELVIGIVTNLKDPDKMGRAKVRLPTLGDTMESEWARIVTPQAGQERGFAFLPQIGDEVVVAFEHGDTRRPLIIGSLHDGKGLPTARMGGDLELGGSMVVAGDQNAALDFKKQLTIACQDELLIDVKRGSGPEGRGEAKPTTRKGEYRLTADGKIAVKGGAEIELTSTGAMKLKTSSTLELESTGALKVKSASGVTVEGMTVEVKAQSQLKLDGTAGIDIQSSGIVNIKGTMINLG